MTIAEICAALESGSVNKLPDLRKVAEVIRCASDYKRNSEMLDNHCCGMWVRCKSCDVIYSHTGNWPDDRGTGMCTWCRLQAALAKLEEE